MENESSIREFAPIVIFGAIAIFAAFLCLIISLEDWWKARRKKIKVSKTDIQIIIIGILIFSFKK